MAFEGKTIIITGAGGNFGREGCLFFAEKGANVAAFDVNLKTLEETSKFVKDKHPDAKIVCKECNVTDASNVQAAVDAVVAEFGSIDLLWNNAGYQGQIKVLLTRWTVLYDYGCERN
jgi:NAD(P)-dependent dehydrogenase (short-subunit alcohol dehydrogenase family)